MRVLAARHVGGGWTAESFPFPHYSVSPSHGYMHACMFVQTATNLFTCWHLFFWLVFRPIHTHPIYTQANPPRTLACPAAAVSGIPLHPDCYLNLGGQQGPQWPVTMAIAHWRNNAHRGCWEAVYKRQPFQEQTCKESRRGANITVQDRQVSAELCVFHFFFFGPSAQLEAD